MPSVVPFSAMLQVCEGGCPPLVSVRVIHWAGQQGGVVKRVFSTRYNDGHCRSTGWQKF